MSFRSANGLSLTIVSVIKPTISAIPSSFSNETLALKRKVGLWHTSIVEVNTSIQYKTQEFPSSSVTLMLPPLDSETSWPGELWSKTNLLKWQNLDNSIFFFFFSDLFGKKVTFWDFLRISDICFLSLIFKFFGFYWFFLKIFF